MPGLNRLRQTFAKVFGYGECGEELRVFFAPGRVNLIGEHTDFTGGYVLPAALTYGTWAVVHPRKDRRFRLASTSFAGQVEIDADEVVYRQADGWANYPKGVFSEFIRLGSRLKGYDILYDGNIPKGAGLSSSASIEMVTATALNQVEALDYSLIDLTQLAQRAENQFVGMNCGIMDQFASGMGKAGNAVLLKCDTLEYRYVPLAWGDYRLVITNSNKQRSLTESKYNQRRQECEEGFNILRKHLPGIVSLGNVSLAQWQEVQNYVRAPEVYKRLDHVIHENERTLASTSALEAGNIQDFGQYMIQSHESLRDLFEVTGPELDALFEEARQVGGCLGTRMTGAGFGGCTVSLVHTEAVTDFETQVTLGYRSKTGLIPTFYHCDSGDGARELIGR
ncbi:galactokinase [Desulfosporosinus fructosivorans]|uniref:Galactokinase n=1 Tax=Desulfosporosinus fructosivorans TaxID=2018669 RepID=A0A4Z0R597_9FIRM|nr:galactokinase [Desulfosporosinus fructosivorans]TGE38010.1 galactokinase [Desulfosporosinus fructosivorans]